MGQYGDGVEAAVAVGRVQGVVEGDEVEGAEFGELDQARPVGGGPGPGAAEGDGEMEFAGHAVLLAYFPALGRPGGLISDLVTASSDSPQRFSTFA